MPAPIKLMLDVNATKGSITAGINSIVRGLTPPPVKLKVELDSDRAISQLNALTSQERHIRVGVDLGQGTNGLQDLENRLNRIQEATRNTANNMRGQVRLDNLTNSFDRFEVRVDRMRTAVANLQQGFENGIRSQSGTRLSDSLTNIINEYDELRRRLDAHNDGIEVLDADELADIQNRFRSLQVDASRFSSEINKLGDAASFDRLQSNITNLTSKVEKMRDSWSAMFSNRDLARQHETLLNNLRTGTMTAEDYSARVLEFSRLSRDVQRQGLDHVSVFGRLQKAFSNFGAFFTASRVFYKGVEEIRKMVSAVTELDTAMVELRKVSDASDTQLSRFFEGTKTSAVELGTTMHDLINATADYSRLGYSLPEAENLAKVATVYKTVGDDVDTIDQATSSLISTMKGFGIETKDASSIVDKFNEVGNRFAISSGGIGEALQRSAASFKAANNTIDESIALVVAANNVIQDPDVVGKHLPKNVVTRFRKVAISVKDQRWFRPRKDFIVHKLASWDFVRKGEIFIAKKTGIYVACENCGKVVYKTQTDYKRHKHHYCSNACQLQKQAKQAYEDRTCEFCGSVFHIRKKQTKRFCSIECQNNWQKTRIGKDNPKYERHQLFCDNCGSEIFVIDANLKRYKNHFCSSSCRQEWYSNVWSQQEDWKDESRKRAAKQIRKMPFTLTKPHVTICELLESMDVDYEVEHPTEYYSIDIYLTEYNLMIEIMGDFWHCNPLLYDCPKQKVQVQRIPKDYMKHDYIVKNYNVEILYLWETDIISDIEKCKCLISRYISDCGIINNYHSFNWNMNNGKLNVNNDIIIPFQDSINYNFAG